MIDVSPELLALAERSPDLHPQRADEPYRRALTGLYARMAATARELGHLEAMRHAVGEAAPYASVEEFAADLETIHRSLCAHKSALLARGRLRGLRRAVGVFGFHLAAVDLRQNSEVHERVVAELFAAARPGVEYVGLGEEARVELLVGEHATARPLASTFVAYSDETLSELEIRKNVYYNQVEDDVVRVTIELQHKQHWGYNIAYKGNALTVRIKRQPAVLDIRKLKIAIDAGHGGTNTGASGVRTGAEEKTYTLLFAKAFEKYLKLRGAHKIIMTRRTDTTFDNKDRVLFLQQQNPDLLISFHLNSSNNEEVKGVSTYYKLIGFRLLTTAILRNMLTLGLDEFGNVGNFNFALNGPTDFPNSLVEIAFLSNASDEKRILNAKFRDDVAKKVYLGITQWLLSMK